MAVQHKQLGNILGAAFPGLEGIRTVGGVLTAWPLIGPPQPTDTALQQLVDAYIANPPRTGPPRLTKALTTVTSIPGLRTKVNEIIQLLADRGISKL